jgi:hypothetical protein
MLSTHCNRVAQTPVGLSTGFHFALNLASRGGRRQRCWARLISVNALSDATTDNINKDDRYALKIRVRFSLYTQVQFLL